MADENILAGMTGEQADADIAAREAKVEQLEQTLRVAKDNLKAARAERKHLEEPRDVVERLKANGGPPRLEDTVVNVETAEASGEVG